LPLVPAEGDGADDEQRAAEMMTKDSTPQPIGSPKRVDQLLRAARRPGHVRRHDVDREGLHEHAHHHGLRREDEADDDVPPAERTDAALQRRIQCGFSGDGVHGR
jgi:hypothetical protein